VSHGGACVSLGLNAADNARRLRRRNSRCRVCALADSTTGAGRRLLSCHGPRIRARRSQVFAAIRDNGGAPAALLPRLERFVAERNWLVHRSRHESHRDLYTADTRAALTQRILRIADEALALMKAFQSATDDYLIAHGLSKADIDVRAEQFRREWTSKT
jgi:hypothetical protein